MFYRELLFTWLPLTISLMVTNFVLYFSIWYIGLNEERKEEEEKIQQADNAKTEGISRPSFNIVCVCWDAASGKCNNCT